MIQSIVGEGDVKGMFAGLNLNSLNKVSDKEKMPRDNLLDKIDSWFLSKPTTFTFLIAVLVSFIAFLFLANFNIGESKSVKLEVVNDSENQNVEGVKDVKSGDSANDSREYEKSDIIVDLSGAVNKPGLYTLKYGSRLGDLLSLGGGFTNEASVLWVSKNVNLALKLQDGDKIYVPFEWDLVQFEDRPKIKALNLGVSSSPNDFNGNARSVLRGVDVASSKVNQNYDGDSYVRNNDAVSKLDFKDQGYTGEPGKYDNHSEVNLINVNSASLSELDTLPGIGSVYATRIIDNRPYKDFEDFKQKSKIPNSLADKLRDLITF